MSGATVELDFWGMEKENSPKSRFQKLIDTRRAVRGTHGSGLLKTDQQFFERIGKLPEISDGFLKREMVFRPNGVLLASETSPFSVPSTPKGNDNGLLSPLPFFNPIHRACGVASKSLRGTPTAPLTIFYKGTVSVFDVPRDKAAVIMKLAEEGNLETAIPVEPVELRFPTSLPLRDEQKLLEKLNGDFPIARKKSLQRFLEKRKERLTSALPYMAIGSECKVTGISEITCLWKLFGRKPYGQNYPQGPTGRCSDGKLVIDFIASKFNLPPLTPYLDKSGKFDHGVNFAVAGSTALSTATLASMNIQSLVTDSSLSVQVGWFLNHLKSICSSPQECKNKLKNSLFVVGEIGGNDFNYAMTSAATNTATGAVTGAATGYATGSTTGAITGAATGAARSMPNFAMLVPRIVGAIKVAVQTVIDAGASQVLVPGNFPVGCFPMYLTFLGVMGDVGLDERKCVKQFNEFAKFQNGLIQNLVAELRQRNPNVNILYVDYYNSFLSAFDNADKLGLDKGSLTKACCGTGGKYNFDMVQICGLGRSKVCPNPGKTLSWDGIHLTEKAYHITADWILADLLPKLKC